MVEELSLTHEKIYIVAHSLGTLLAIEQAIKNKTVYKLFLIAVPLSLSLKPKMAINSLKVYFDKTGAILDEEFENSKCIEAFWCNDEIRDELGEIITWTYETDIPHETFMIYEDGDSYCRGIVFSINDINLN